MGEYSEPWRVVRKPGESVQIYCSRPDSWGNGYLTWLTGTSLNHSTEDDAFCSRIVAAINIVAGIPTERLTTTDPATCMFLAWLRGDETAALAWADEVQARARVGEGFVSRGELSGKLRGLIGDAEGRYDREWDLYTFRIPRRMGEKLRELCDRADEVSVSTDG